MSERFIPAQALSKEQIQRLPNRELANSLSPEERKFAIARAKAEWDSRPMQRAKTESAGDFARRKRTARETDREEYARLQRAALERALYDSKSQKLRRFTDALTSDIDREKAEKNQAVIDDLERKSRLESIGDGGSWIPKLSK